MSSAFLDLTGLSRFLDHLKLLLVQSDWQKTDSTDMAFIKNKPTVTVDEQTLVLTGWGSGSAVETFTVRFMLNDGTETVYDSQTVNSGSTVSVPSDPTRTDYDFGGWYTDSSCTTAFDSTTAITRSTDLYAKWTAQTASTVTITVAALDNQHISLYSTDSSFNFDYTTLTGTIAKGANLVIDAYVDHGYNAGNIIINGTAQAGTHADITADSDLTISAADATKILVNLGNYSGTITVGSQGDPTTQYGGVVGFYAKQFGSISPTSWGDCEIRCLAILYGQFGFGVDAGENSDYTTDCLTGTLTVGTFSAQVSEGVFVDSANTEAFRAYLAQHIGETLSVTFNLSALDGYTKTTVTVGSKSVGSSYTFKGFNSGTGEMADFSAFGSISPTTIGSTAVEAVFSANDVMNGCFISPKRLSARYGDGSDVSVDSSAENQSAANIALSEMVAAMSDGDTFDIYLKEAE